MENTAVFGPEAFDLTSEYLHNPLGIAASRPRFSWKGRHPKSNQMQSAYRLIVATSKEILDRDTGDIWDTGKISIPKSIHIEYNGTPLQETSRYFWKVMIWDADNKASAFSELAWFEIAFFDSTHIKGSWLMTPTPVRGLSPLFRKQLSIPFSIASARAYICGLGYYELSINGTKVSDHVLDPGWTDYNKRVLYVSHDITPHVRNGENGLGIMLGEGWHGNEQTIKAFPQKVPDWLGFPRFLIDLRITGTKGESLLVSSQADGTWKTATGAIVNNGVFCGETYDAQLEKSGWDTATYTPDATWTDAVAAKAPLGILTAQTLEPIRIVGTMSPKSITSPRDGVYVFDNGQNLAGWAQLRVRGPKGQTIEMRFSEILHDDGTIDQGNYRTAQGCDIYTCKGDGLETYEPRFTYHGFRYIQITGFPGVPTLDSLFVRQVRSDVAKTGRFVCSDALLNRIQDCVIWTEESNMHSVPTDCPQRDERMGWLNDATVRVEEALYNFNTAQLLTKWEQDIADTQNPQTGEIRDTAPYVFTCLPGEPVNCSFLLIPWNLYVHYGDKRILADHYDHMKAWTAFIGSNAEDYIVNYSNYGDWAPPQKFVDPASIARSIHTPGALMSTGYYYYNTLLLAQIALILEKTEEAAGFVKSAKAIAAAFEKKFFNAKTQDFATSSQASNTFPLYLGLAPQNLHTSLAEKIAADIALHETHVTTGNLCSRYILEVLSSCGKVDTAFDVATQTTYPSWGYMIAQGATTIWERWENATGGGMNSHNHPMYGSISLWFMKYLAGISPDPAQPGYQHVFIKPSIPTGLTYADGVIETIHGMVQSKWHKTTSGITMIVTIPFNTCGTMCVPYNKTTHTVVIAGAIIYKEGALRAQSGFDTALMPDGYIAIKIGSGTTACTITNA